MFKTKRLTLRAYNPDTDDAFQLECWNDLDLQRGTRSAYNVPLGKPFLETVHTWVKKAIIWVTLVETDTAHVVGHCTLWFSEPERNRDATLGINIARPFWDKGYGTEVMGWMRDYAFNDLGMQSFVGRVC